EAEKFFKDAFRISERSGNSYGMGINQRQLGNIALQTGDFDNAEDIFRKQIEIEETFGSGLGYRIALGYLVDVLVEKLKGRRGEKNQVQIEEVQKKLTEYVEKCTDEDDKIGIAWSKFRNGKLELAIGNIKEGETLIREAMLYCEKLGREDYRKIFGSYLNNSEHKPS
ncbi:MAG: tetratricopeptide repeat protein, partial [Flavobacteriaceae bacterium]